MPIVANTANFTTAQNGQVAQYGIPVYYPAFRYFDRAGLPRGPLKDTVDAFYRTMDTAKIVPDVVYGNVWDSGLLVVSAFRALGMGRNVVKSKSTSMISVVPRHQRHLQLSRRSAGATTTRGW